MTEISAEAGTDRAVSVALVADPYYPHEFAWNLGELIGFLEGPDDLFWLAEGVQPTYSECFSRAASTLH